MKRKKHQIRVSKKPFGPEDAGFNVADLWPLDKAPEDAKKKAVQSLVANHTLIVGQSRSGKTTAARRLLEEIVTWTDTRLVILDPNADFRWLKKVDRKIANPDKKIFSSRWREIAKTIGVASPTSGTWGIRWNKLDLKEMAAFLRLTPADNFEEYRHLDRHVKYQEHTSGLSTLDEFLKSQYFEVAVGEDLERYRLLLKKLSELDVWWNGKGRDLDSLFKENYRTIVVDLSKDDQQVRMITAARTLEALWRQGEEQRREFLKSESTWSGTLVVIDEGHLFAPVSSDDPQKRLVSERIQRFADQGKKLNLYLMVITQQPGKLHAGVLSEFNNRIILRVNERQSLKTLEETFGGFRGRYDGALTFEPGEALIEGALLSDESPPPAAPRGVRFRRSRTREGGGTPNADWAVPKRV